MRLIRHAQASWGSADYDCLSPLGETQARYLGAWLAGETTAYAQVVRGSLRRHAQTLELIAAEFAAAGRELPAARIDPDWNEFDHVPVLRAYAAAHPDDADVVGARAGNSLALRGLLMAALQGWREGRFDDVAGETWPAFGARVAAARERIGAHDGAVLVVTSGGAIWRCAQAALYLDDQGLTEAKLSFLRNTSISEFEHGRERWRMLSWDTVPHFDAHGHEHLHSHY
ncbi:MAG TPA: histidine phosphatase family protein [Rhodanobacteraceae bacterium]|nr:histidine phosphatase family protein [Rhodanobacteraceae bacterium]